MPRPPPNLRGPQRATFLNVLIAFAFGAAGRQVRSGGARWLEAEHRSRLHGQLRLGRAGL